MLCPMAERGKFIAGDFDECENCQYFGIIQYRVDTDTGDKRISIETEMCKESWHAEQSVIIDIFTLYVFCAIMWVSWFQKRFN